ncbi:hypothetical protein GCM10017714_19930 [Curtobacterium pusillum]|nr:hypothetical protein GCM10017610_26390 [Curtobacterium pusillum]
MLRVAIHEHVPNHRRTPPSTTERRRHIQHPRTTDALRRNREVVRRSERARCTQLAAGNRVPIHIEATLHTRTRGGGVPNRKDRRPAGNQRPPRCTVAALCRAVGVGSYRVAAEIRASGCEDQRVWSLGLE